jgi:carboxyl-terminal processing protease
MKLKLITCLFLLPFLSFAQQPLTGADSARMVIDSVLNYAKINSLHRDRVNWQVLTDSVKKYSAAATNIQEAMPALQVMYKMLGDFHGAAYYQKKQYKWVTTVMKMDYKPYIDLLKGIRNETPHIETRMLEKGYGYIAIPSNNPTKAGEVDAIARQIQDSLNQIKPC